MPPMYTAECTKIARFSAAAAAIFTAQFFGAPRCAISSAKKIASEPRFLLRRKWVKMVLAAEFPAASSAMKIASERRCAISVHSGTQCYRRDNGGESACTPRPYLDLGHQGSEFVSTNLERSIFDCLRHQSKRDGSAELAMRSALLSGFRTATLLGSDDPPFLLALKLPSVAYLRPPNGGAQTKEPHAETQFKNIFRHLRLRQHVCRTKLPPKNF